ncbi:MAG: hypothetical protein ACTSQG_10770, partial [Promethearchaeota archaeon]
KYLAEEWEKDKAKILEYIEDIKKSIEEALTKGPKKMKKLEVKEKAKVSEKAEELEKGKAKEIQQKLVKAKEEFSLEDSIDKAKAPPTAIPEKAPPSKAPPSKAPSAKVSAKKEPSKAPPAEDKIKKQIIEIEKEIKQLRKKKNNVKAAEMMTELAELYKKAGDAKKAQQVYDEQNKLTIQTLKDMQVDLLKKAKEAEKKKDWKAAADLYAECKEISSNLFKAGKMDESDNVKQYTNLENKCRSKLK